MKASNFLIIAILASITCCFGDRRKGVIVAPCYTHRFVNGKLVFETNPRFIMSKQLLQAEKGRYELFVKRLKGGTMWEAEVQRLGRPIVYGLDGPEVHTKIPAQELTEGDTAYVMGVRNSPVLCDLYVFDYRPDAAPKK